MNIITYKVKNILLLFSTMFIFLYFLLNAELVASTTISAMTLCFLKVIPSIFPFMVISSFLLNSRLLKFNPSKNNFLGVILISWLSGFVVGPKFLSEISDDIDLTQMNALLSNAGIGFVVSYIGATLWNNIMFGVYLYLIQIASGIIIYGVGHKSCFILPVSDIRKSSIIKSFCDSVQDSTKTMLNICGFTIFFSILSNLLGKLLCEDKGLFSYIFSSIMEISSGVYSSTMCENVLLSAFLVGFSIGFGGVCMCMQTFSVAGQNLNRKKFILIKLIQGLICGIFGYAYVLIFKLEPTKSVVLVSVSNYRIVSIVFSTLFLFCALIYFKKAVKNIDFS